MEEWPITFKTSADAVAWAEKFLTASRPDQYMMIPPTNDGRPKVSIADMSDMAQTVSVEVSRVRYPARAVYRYVYGRSLPQIDVACMICQRIWANDDRIGTDKENTCIKLILLVLEGRRRIENMEPRMTMARMARRLGISRMTLYNHWQNEIDAVKQEIDRLIAQGDTALDIQLSKLGFFG